jgi:hypothetical protein
VRDLDELDSVAPHPIAASHVAAGLCPNVVVKGRSMIETVLCARPFGHVGGCSVQPQSHAALPATSLNAGNASDAQRLIGARGRLARALDAVGRYVAPDARESDLRAMRRVLRERLRAAYAANASIGEVANLRAAVEAIGAVFAWMEEP